MCPLRPRRILPVMVAFDGDVVVVLESERQRWTETVGVDDSLSRELVKTTASVLADRGRLAHAAPMRARPRGAPEEREKWSNEHQRLFGYSLSIASGVRQRELRNAPPLALLACWPLHGRTADLLRAVHVQASYLQPLAAWNRNLRAAEQHLV